MTGTEERSYVGSIAARPCASVLAVSRTPPVVLMRGTGFQSHRVGSATVRRPQRVTILDVAARAGVHAATVSRTINVPEMVAPATRLRVEKAVRDLGFVPNRAARGLITGRTGNVAVIVPDITNPHFASLVRSVERSARGADLQVLLVDTGEHPSEEVRAAQTLSRDVDGFVVVSPRRLHRELGALGSSPAVFVNRPVGGHASILLRTAPAVAELLHHLSSLGHEKLRLPRGTSGIVGGGRAPHRHTSHQSEHVGAGGRADCGRAHL